MAVGSEAGSLIEGTPDSDVSVNLGGFPLGSLKGEGEFVQIITLDQMIGQIKRVGLLKADVEGWERDVLLGSQKIIARDRPIIYVENDRTDKSAELISLIMGMNYHLWWHIVPLYRVDNFANTSSNIFGKVGSFNMLCIPAERGVTITHLQKIQDTQFHPLHTKPNLTSK